MHTTIDTLSSADKEMKILKISWQVWRMLCILLCLFNAIPSIKGVRTGRKT